MIHQEQLNYTSFGKNVLDEDEESKNVNDYQSFEQGDPEESEDSQSENKDSLVFDDKKLYKCQHCEYHSTQKGHVKNHVQSIHEGVRYSCQQCDFNATDPCSLRQHIKSKHLGIKYPCQQCDYKATDPSNLRRHKKSNHQQLSVEEIGKNIVEIRFSR